LIQWLNRNFFAHLQELILCLICRRLCQDKTVLANRSRITDTRRQLYLGAGAQQLLIEQREQIVPLLEPLYLPSEIFVSVGTFWRKGSQIFFALALRSPNFIAKCILL
jgi:hypothetical protein